MVALACLALGLLGPPAEAHRPVHRALLIGVCDYENAGWSWKPKSPLHSDKDVQKIHDVLIESCDFKEDEIRELVGVVRKQQILDGLKWLFKEAGKDDVMYLHYSGHGASVDAPRRRTNGLENTARQENGLVPSDAQDLAPNRMVMCTYLASLVKRVSSPNVLLTFDSCNSGDVTRGAQRGIYIARGGAYRGAGKRQELPAPGDEGFLTGMGKYVAISAARYDQEAKEDPATGGVFTSALAKAFTLSKNEGSYRDLFEIVDDQMETDPNLKDQNPVASGLLDRKLFSGDAVPRQAYFRVYRKGWIRLMAGEVHGISVGSEVAIYERGRSASPAGLATVTSVSATESSLKPEPESVKALQEANLSGARAEITKVGLGDGSVRVLLSGTAAQTDRDWIKELATRLPIVPVSKAPYDLRLQPVGDALVLVDADGSPLLLAPDSQAGLQAIESKIGRVTKWKMVKGITNVAGPNVRVSLRVRRVLTNEVPGGFEFKQALYEDPKRIDNRFTFEEHYALQARAERVSAKSAAWEPYIAVLQLKPNHELQPIWPHPGDESQKDAVLPVDGKWYWLAYPNGFVAGEKGSKLVDVIQFSNNPKHPIEYDGPGTQIFKLMATSKPVDYSGLFDTNRGDEETRGADTPLARLLRIYATGTRSPSRGVIPTNWTTTSATAITVVSKK